MRAMALLLLVSCGDTDTDTDTDTRRPDLSDSGETSPIPTTESDCTDGLDEDEDGLTDCADSDCVCIETDCTDGTDDDGDGLLDCEDSDCVDICVEICDDNTDNDADGQIDCSDDECFGIAGCGGAYNMTLSYETMLIAWARGAATDTYPYRLRSYVEAYASVTAVPVGDWGGESFRCTGQVESFIGFSTYSSTGGRYIGPASEPGYLVTLAPTIDDDSLQWSSGSACPITAFPVAKLGFLLGSPTIYRYPEIGDRYEQYVPGSVGEETYYDDDKKPFDVRWLYDIDVMVPPTWVGFYD
ncbi:MAG: hypothetical protein ACI8S6_001129 [Myxococcota bacterium]|jgi:hypothetical protein